MATENVFFTWEFPEEAIQKTNSPLAQTIFQLPGNYTVYLNATKKGKYKLCFCLNCLDYIYVQLLCFLG